MAQQLGVFVSHSQRTTPSVVTWWARCAAPGQITEAEQAARRAKEPGWQE